MVAANYRANGHSLQLPSIQPHQPWHTINVHGEVLRKTAAVKTYQDSPFQIARRPLAPSSLLFVWLVLPHIFDENNLWLTWKESKLFSYKWESGCEFFTLGLNFELLACTSNSPQTGVLLHKCRCKCENLSLHNVKCVNADWCRFSSSSDSDCGSQLPCDQLVSPKALAACTRVDSCFAPWFVPSLGVSVQIAQLDVRLCHHLEQLGTGTAQAARTEPWV